MIDIHCHILPGIDDGPAHLDESVEMAGIASCDGITTIVATPHVKDDLYPARVIREGVDRLNERIAALGIPLVVVTGADVNALVDPSLLGDYTINGTGYILLEFPHTHIPQNARDILFRVMAAGLRPIITHPERNLAVIRNPDLLLELSRGDSLIQITAASLTGDMGPDVRECASYLLRKDVVSVIATDAHSSVRRRPVLSEGLRVAEGIIGRERASRLVGANPEAVLQGRPVDETE